MNIKTVTVEMQQWVTFYVSKLRMLLSTV